MAGARPVSVATALATFASLKWHLLRGGLRRGSSQRPQTIMAMVTSTVLGLFGAVLLFALGRGAAIAEELIVVVTAVTVFAIGLLSASTGVESSIDPRHLVAEPLGRWTLGLGMLVAAAIGPPGLMAVLAGVGIVAGWAGGGPWSIAVVLAAVVAWWATLLLFSRTFANLLGALATGRLQQVAQVAATASALVAWVLVQVLANDASAWDERRWESLAGWAARTPPGQLGRAIAAAPDPGSAFGHLLIGVAWLLPLAWISVWSTERLALSSPSTGRRRSSTRHRGDRSGVPVLERLLPDSPAGMVAARTVRTKLRTPRQAVNTLTALAIGAGVFLLGPVMDPEVDPRLVVVAGLLHVAVLFDGNNAFGMDGPALWAEVAAGADGRVLVRGKVLSSLVVMSVPAVMLPVVMASLTGGWQWLPSGWLVALGSVLGASGVAVASATFAPVAMPDSPNPLAAGDTGQGCIAGLMLALCAVVLALVSLPVAVGIYVVSDTSASWSTLVAAAAPAVGALVLWAGMSLATLRLEGHEERLLQQVTPAR